MRKQGSPNGGDAVSDAQSMAQLRALRRDDSSVVDIVVSCSHAALYVLENGTALHWRKLGVEGFFYVVKRNTSPKYKIILKNQTDSGEGDFSQSMDDGIRYEVKEDTFFYQVGSGDDVRGLWFYDKEFMVKFVGAVEHICNDLHITCDGTYDEPSLPSQPRPSSSNSGKAILQLLKKDSPSVPNFPPQSSASPVDVRSLLRKEFASPSTSTSRPEMTPPTYHSPHLTGSLPPPGRPLDFSGPQLVPSDIQYGRAITATPQKASLNRDPVDLVTVSRDDIRSALHETINSDEFLASFYEKLCNRSRR